MAEATGYRYFIVKDISVSKKDAKYVVTLTDDSDTYFFTENETIGGVSAYDSFAIELFPKVTLKKLDFDVSSKITQIAAQQLRDYMKLCNIELF